MPLKVEPILPRFGAYCSGLDLTRPLGADEVRQVTDAMDRWGVTVWRDTGMNDDQHVMACACASPTASCSTLPT
jgi:alpha-ketoglutarate-dependent 2,4-dichlorophenoxyacetate dioxygenase